MAFGERQQSRGWARFKKKFIQLNFILRGIFLIFFFLGGVFFFSLWILVTNCIRLACLAPGAVLGRKMGTLLLSCFCGVQFEQLLRIFSGGKSAGGRRCPDGGNEKYVIM